jgi:hypothetical protein
MKYIIFLSLLITLLSLKTNVRKSLSYEIGYIVEGLLGVRIDVRKCGSVLPKDVHDRNEFIKTLDDLLLGLTGKENKSGFFTSTLLFKTYEKVSDFMIIWLPYINCLIRSGGEMSLAESNLKEMADETVWEALLNHKIGEPSTTTAVLENFELFGGVFSVPAIQTDRHHKYKYEDFLYHQLMKRIQNLKMDQFKFFNELVQDTLNDLREYLKNSVNFISSDDYKNEFKEAQENFKTRVEKRVKEIYDEQLEDSFNNYKKIWTNAGDKEIEEKIKPNMNTASNKKYRNDKATKEVEKEIENEVEDKLKFGEEIRNSARLILNKVGLSLRVFLSEPGIFKLNHKRLHRKHF